MKRAALRAARFVKLTLTKLSIFAATRTERMRIDHNGNVGIGTTTPTGLLSLRASSGDVIQSFSNAGGIGGELQIRYRYESAQHRIGWTDGLGNRLFYSQWAPSNTDSVGFFPWTSWRRHAKSTARG
jgi:hypothetical protein